MTRSQQIEAEVRAIISDIARQDASLIGSDEDLVERLAVDSVFLAVLELFKQGLIELEQAVMFGRIEVIWLGDQTGETRVGLARYFEGSHGYAG